MLHNTGSYGPGEQPVNMGTSLNLSQLNGMNLVNNIGKNVQEQSQIANGHYNLPTYSTYGSQALNMTSQFTQFSNYNGIYPANFSLHNSTPTDYSSWHNGISSMNVNSQNLNCYDNVLNYSQNHDRKVSEAPINMRTGKKDPRLSVPQIFSKEYLDNEAGYQDNIRFSARSRELERNIVARSEGKLSMDTSRRRSLENTVKLIENLLLNSTAKHKEHHIQVNTKESVKVAEKDQIPAPTRQRIDTCHLSVNTTETTKKSPKLYDILTKEQSETETFSTALTDNIGKTSEHTENRDDDKSSVTSDEAPLKKQNDEILPKIEIKVEEVDSWTDCDYPNPFRHDCHSVLRDHVESCFIIDVDKSISEAFEACKRGNWTERLYYECPHCNVLIQHPKRFLIHTKWHTLGFNKKIDMARKREMRKEAKIIEKMRTEDQKPDQFQCKDCDRVFNTKSSLKNHRHRIHSVRGLEIKIRPRPTVSSFQCPDCSKRFKHKHSLEKHRDTHLEKTHPCAECPKKFGSQVLLKMHMKSHERAQRGPTFRCTYCGKGYYEAYTLQVHERTHRNERPYSCNICNATFGTNSSLKRHIRVSHSTSKPYECKTCHRCFVSESIRNRHEMRAHGDPEEFKFTCKTCPARYLKLKDLQRHSCKAHRKTNGEDNSKSDDE